MIAVDAIAVSATGPVAFCYHPIMSRLAPAFALATITACGLAACNHGPKPRPYPAPTVADLLARLTQTTEQVTSFYADDTLMDYWMNDERVKGTVAIMGTTGAKVRVNALSPAGGDVLSDLACDGEQYVFVDNTKNCYRTGPCSRDTVAAMFRIALAPDELMRLAIGGTPIIAGATGTVTWDGKTQRETLQLSGEGGRTQTIVLDARDGRADVISSEVKDAGGALEWRIDNTGFSKMKDNNGMERRVPDKSRFRSAGGDKADLLVEWNERQLGLELEDAKFVREVPDNLPTCP